MQYHDLEANVYGLLRQGKTAQALLEVMRRASTYTGPDYYAALQLRANVQLLAGAANIPICADMVERVVTAMEAEPLIRFKAHLLGAHIARRWRDNDLWTEHLTGMQNLVVSLPDWQGRFLRSHAHYAEMFESPQAALERHHETLQWHLQHIGPYDHSDRLCYLAMSYNSETQLYIQLGNLEAAKETKEAALAHMPPDAYQRIYAIIGEVMYCLAVCDLDGTEQALVKATACLVKRPDCCAAEQVNELRVAHLSRTGKGAEARQLLDGMTVKASVSRHMETIRRLEALTFNLP